MNNIDHYDLYITPLSPLHLGTDEDYTPTNYVMDQRGLHQFTFEDVMSVIDSGDRAQLDRIVRGRPDAMVLSIQRLFAEWGEKLIGISSHSVEVADGVWAQYQQRLGKVANRERSGKGVANQLEIGRTAYNPVTGASMIPGSGIKGALRTALLNHQKNGNSSGRRESNRDLQQRLFQYREMHQDPMRLIKLDDAVVHNPELAGRKVYFAVNRKRRASKTGKDRRSNGPAQRLESLRPLSPRAYLGGCMVTSMKAYRQRNQDKVPQLEFTVGQIMDACNAFYRPLLDNEIAGMTRMGLLDSDWHESVESVLSLVHQQQKTVKGYHTALIRLGRHSGAEAVTIDGMRSIKIMQGPGKKPLYQSNGTTWWMAAEQEDATTGLLPYGWALIELVEQGRGKLPDNQTMKSLGQRARAEYAQWNTLVTESRMEAERIAQQQQEIKAQQAEQLRTKELVWSAATVKRDPGAGKLFFYADSKEAMAEGEVAKKMLDQFSKNQLKRIRQGLQVTVKVEAQGNRFIALEIVKP